MRDIISVRQSAPGVFVFTCEGKCGEPEEIRLLKTPEEKDAVKNGVPVEFGRCKTSAGEFEARIPDLDHRPYFLPEPWAPSTADIYPYITMYIWWTPTRQLWITSMSTA